MRVCGSNVRIKKEYDADCRDIHVPPWNKSKNSLFVLFHRCIKRSSVSCNGRVDIHNNQTVIHLPFFAKNAILSDIYLSLLSHLSCTSDMNNGILPSATSYRIARVRCHMKFYPRVDAGLVKKRDDNYWLLPNFKSNLVPDGAKETTEHVFLWQHYTFPFAFPHTQRTFNVEEGAVDEIVTFPPDVTKRKLIGEN
jgi:hypothetical protein